MPKYFVISGNYDQFTSWRNRNAPEMLLNHQISNLHDLTYVKSVHDIKGITNPAGIFIGTWYHRSDIKEILIQLNVSMTNLDRVEPITKAWEIIHRREEVKKLMLQNF